MDVKSDVEVRGFCSILDSHGLTQHVNGTNHKGSHALEFIEDLQTSQNLE